MGGALSPVRATDLQVNAGPPLRVGVRTVPCTEEWQSSMSGKTSNSPEGAREGFLGLKHKWECEIRRQERSMSQTVGAG